MACQPEEEKGVSDKDRRIIVMQLETIRVLDRHVADLERRLNERDKVKHE